MYATKCHYKLTHAVKQSMFYQSKVAHFGLQSREADTTTVDKNVTFDSRLTNLRRLKNGENI